MRDGIQREMSDGENSHRGMGWRSYGRGEREYEALELFIEHVFKKLFSRFPYFMLIFLIMYEDVKVC